MDKYEFNIKVEQIKKLVNKGDYETAMKIADTIDWRRVRSTSLLTMVAQVYERNAEYQDAKDILLLAFERAPIGKGLLFKLTDLALREGNIQEAEAYYREFCDLAGDDPRQNLLRFLILEAKEASVEQQINSLERYCQEELDEKWLYHLAELYQEAGREEDCVRICDKIMLLFGLGKYVDKAMELKLQYAPLTKYQMDLVENREKYEEKLRAVEEEYKKGTYRREPEEEEYFDSEDGEEDPDTEDRDDRRLEEDVEVSLHEAKAEEELAREMSKLEPYDEEEDSAIGETRVLDNIKDMKAYRDRMYAEEREASAEDADGPGAQMEAASREMAAAREAAAGEADVIRNFEEEEETIIEDWDLEPDEETSNHLMIEAEEPEKGLSLALESLRKIHRELGTKNPVAKISGEKLNRKGVFAVSDRLAGKDLVIERAADLDRITIEELGELMERDETGMIVVLIDTPVRMERLHGSYPALAGKFQYIGCEGAAGKAAAPGLTMTDAEKAQEEARMRAQSAHDAEEARRRLAEREEEIRRQAARDAEEARRRQAEREEEARRQAEYEAEEARRQAELEAAEAVQHRAELEADEARRQAEYEEEMRRRQADAEDERRQARYEEDEEQPQEEYEGGGAYDHDEAYGHDEAYDQDKAYGHDEAYSQAEDYGPEDAYPSEEAYEPEAKEAGRDGEMDVEEFAQYACKYAAEIDCSISGKSMLALYERAEMMEEDGVPLTKANAEELIEEAADKAEKKSFGGLFSPQYDKDGLLILKEKHFFD